MPKRFDLYTYNGWTLIADNLKGGVPVMVEGDDSASIARAKNVMHSWIEIERERKNRNYSKADEMRANLYTQEGIEVMKKDNEWLNVRPSDDPDAFKKVTFPFHNSENRS